LKRLASSANTSLTAVLFRLRWAVKNKGYLVVKYWPKQRKKWMGFKSSFK
jgi:hypothetical protein